MRRNSVTTKKGVYLTLLVIAAIVAAILVNAVISKIPSDYTKFDLTGKGTFRLTQQTQDIVGGLQEDVNLYFVYDTSGGNETIKYISQLLERYESLSKHIKVSVVDPTLQPNFILKYSSVEIQDGSVIVDGPKRPKIVSNNEIFTYNTTSYLQTGNVDISFRGEEAITSAISFAISDSVPVIYVTQGHSEKVPDENILSYIWADNYEITELSLLSVNEIPSEVDCVLMNAPTSDITEHEMNILRQYLKNGGNFYLLTTYTETEMPNLMSVMADYGLSQVPGFVIDSDPNYCFRGQPHYVMPDNNYHEITAPLYAKGLRVLMRFPQAIEIALDKPEGVTATALFFSSKSSLSKMEIRDTIEKEEGDLQGPFALGVAAERGDTRVVWMGSADLTVDEIDSSVSGNNRDMFMNALAWLCDWEQTISIRSTSIGGGKLAPTDLQRMVWGIVYPVLIILAVLICGMAVWIRRRKR